MKSLKRKKKKLAKTFVWLYQLRYMVGHFKKTYLHGLIKILQFLKPARIQKRLT